MSAHPLRGKRIVITRQREKAAPFAEKLRALGAEPLIVPTIATRLPVDRSALDAALSCLAVYHWVIFTSANAVRHVWERLSALGRPAPLAWPAVAAIGPATARALLERGVRARLVPSAHVAEALAEALTAHADLRGKHILLPQSDLARPVLAELLRAAGAEVHAVVAYETFRPPADPAALQGPLDALTFTSPSTARNFAAMFPDVRRRFPEALIGCIGPITARAVRALGWTVDALADPHTEDGLIAALGAAFAARSTTSHAHRKDDAR